ncbi:FAD dependent oxidoreductase [Zopfia rhizophila CBS 207.26]|uniref:FAD dependent oxidoreductase n=1 Tax=Zopfia rhizophila CBS 207.26 TaxID=1314779 RepID=A0A6A6DLE7_9PEZI|nr:FAD dependent oxidoreductase [Zopfia rhizophila CBS 207.26]
MSSRNPFDGVYEKGAIDPGVPVANPSASFWHSQPSKYHEIRSPWPEVADVVVIGSGMTGTSIARTLYARRPELNIVLVEARFLCSGATGRNGGHIKAVSYEYWKDRKKKFGADEAVRWARFEQSHLKEMAACVRENNINCDLDLKEGIVAHYDKKSFGEAVDALRELQLYAPQVAADYTVYSQADAVSKFKCSTHTVGAIGSPSAAVWPYKLVTSLIEQMVDKNYLNVQTHTQVLSIEEGDDFAVVKTDRGNIRATHVVHATNGWLGHLVPELRSLVSPVRGNVECQILPANLKIPSTVWMRHSDKDWDYLIQRPAGEVIVGRANSGRKMSADDSIIDVYPHAHLGGILPHVLNWGSAPNQSRVTHAWSGIVGFTEDGNPFVGSLSFLTRTKHQWVCGGYHGIGMVKAFRTGQVLAHLLLGEEVPFEYPSSMLIDSRRLAQLQRSLSGSRL